MLPGHLHEQRSSRSLALGVELIEHVLQRVQLLAGLGVFALSGEALVIVEVMACFGDEGSGVWRRG